MVQYCTCSMHGVHGKNPSGHAKSRHQVSTPTNAKKSASFLPRTVQGLMQATNRTGTFRTNLDGSGWAGTKASSPPIVRSDRWSCRHDFGRHHAGIPTEAIQFTLTAKPSILVCLYACSLALFVVVNIQSRCIRRCRHLRRV